MEQSAPKVVGTVTAIARKPNLAQKPSDLEPIHIRGIMEQTGIKGRIRDWWANAPMTYAERHGDVEYTRPDGTKEKVALGSRRFYEVADERFYSWNTQLHLPDQPFGRMFPYDRYRGKRVLEVGCGMGCMAMNWARNGADMTAVDLNPVAIQQTRQRFELFGLKGAINEADGELLPFEDATFDYVYSWGVLHHSPNTKQSIAELLRVLKPGGQAGVMLYHRNSILFDYTVRWVEGYINMENEFLDETELASRYGDGGREEGNPHTWPVTEAEVRGDLFAPYQNVNITVLGADVPPILNTWRPNFASRMDQEKLDALASRKGWSLWITGDKPS